MTTQRELVAFGQDLLGETVYPLACHAGHARTVILRANTDRHGDVIVKIHRDGLRHQREARAYRIWTRALGDRVPQLLACADDPPGIVVTALPGSSLAETKLTIDEEQDAYRQAGAVLAQLHNAGPTRTDKTFVNWLADRGDYWLSRAAPQMTPAEQNQSRRKLAQLIRMPASTLVPCHLDFTPRNLIRADDGTVRLIDFEHSRYDLAARDLVRLATRIWPDRPDLATAFQSTYGPLTENDMRIIDCCAVIDHASRLAAGLAMTKVGSDQHANSP